MYDIFYVSETTGNDEDWFKIKSKYSVAQRLTNITSYDQIKSKAFTKMFWVIWDDIQLSDNFDLMSYKATKWDDMYVHVFKNGDNYDGICLFSKTNEISKREFQYRFFTNKKEVDIVASTPKSHKLNHDIFFVSQKYIEHQTWEEIKERYPRAQKIENVKNFEEVKSKATTDYFWVVWDHLEIRDEWKFNYVIPKWDEEYIHVFKNNDFYDGICIFRKDHRILQREWDYRFFTKKKEINITASRPKTFDIVFISYNEPFADNNWHHLLTKADGYRCYRVNGVKGIHQAHIAAAEMVGTEMFWVVDADAEILDSFDFSYQIPYYDFVSRSAVHVWQSKNPVNDLVYGYGGIKLLPTLMTKNMDLSKPDMTTSISKQFKSIKEISNITRFNTDPFTTWRSAFRECSKLSSRVIDRQDDKETQERLDIWCEKSTDEYALDGARAGRAFGTANRTDLETLKKINDYNWLKEQFDGRYSKN